MELVPARFGMLAVFAKDIQYGKHTYNARSDRRSAQQLQSRLGLFIIPAEALYEPDWRSGKHVDTHITRADARAWVWPACGSRGSCR